MCGKRGRRRRAPSEIVERAARAAARAPSSRSLAPLVTHRKGEFRELFDELRDARVRARRASTARSRRLDEVARARQEAEAHDRARRRPPRRRAPTSARASPRAIELALARRQGRAARRRRARTASAPSAQRAARAAASRFPSSSPQSFSFNSPLGMCAACNGLGTALEVDPELVVPDSVALDPRGRHRPVGERRWRAARAGPSASPTRVAQGAAASTSTCRGSKLPQGEAGAWCSTASTGKRIAVALGQGGHARATAPWAMRYEGVIPQPRCAASARPTREPMREQYRQVLRASAVRRLRRQAPAPGEPRGAASAARASPTSPSHDRRATRATHFERARARRRAQRRSPRACCARSTRAPRASCSTSGSTTSRSTAPAPTLSRRRGAAHPPREPARQRALAASCTCSTSQSSACTSATTRASSRRCAACAISATPCSSSSTTRRRSAPPTTSSTSGRAPGTSAARSSFSGTPEALASEHEQPHRRVPRRARSASRSPTTRRTPTGVARGRAARASTTCSDIDVKLPLGVLAAVTGVSGAGKSSLVNGILLPALARALHGSDRAASARTDASTGLDAIDKVDRDRPEADRPHAALEPRHVHQGVRRTSARSSPSCPTRARAAATPGASAST